MDEAQFNLDNFSSLKSEQIIDVLKNQYHQKLRSDIHEIADLFQKVSSVHGQKHPELLQALKHFTSLVHNIEFHVAKEENVIFPLMIEFENGKAIMPKEAFAAPVNILTEEHSNDIQFILQLEKLTKNFEPPSDACQSFQRLYQKLSEFSQDIREHMSIEDKVLFPRFQTEKSDGCCGSSCNC